MKEKIGIVKLLSLILAFLGLFLIFGLSLAKFSFLALILAAINGVASGAEVATTKKSTEKFSSLQVSVYVWFGIFITHLPLSLLSGEPQIPFQFNATWLSMMAFAAVGLISFWLVVEGYKFVDASIGGLIGLFEIIAGVIFGIVIFNEELTLSTVLGGSLILLAAMLPDLYNLFRRKIYIEETNK
jgi:drug/metabolite transporter (DMT)-like permease